MAQFALVGGSYTQQAVTANAQRCANFFPENDQSGTGKTPNSLLPRAGKRVFLSNSLGPPRAQFSINGRTFVAQGTNATNFLELLVDTNGVGYGVGLGFIADDHLPVSICSNGQMLLIASAGQCYTYDLVGFTGFNRVTDLLPYDISMVGFLDGFFLALRRNSRIFQTSGVEDPTSWDPLDINEISVFGDNVPTMFVDHRQIWFFGLTKSVIYYDSGDATTPFLPLPGGFIEQGIAAMWSVAKIDNTVFWIGGDERGSGVVWRANGTTPTRVSTFPVESAIQAYDRIDDAVAFTYQIDGHAFYQAYFPTVKAGPNGTTASWAYDAVTNFWSEPFFFDTNFAQEEADRAWNHVFAEFTVPGSNRIITKHLVGDWFGGNIFEVSSKFYSDAGVPIRRVRRATYIGDEQQWMFHRQLQIDVEVGLGAGSVDAWSASVNYGVGEGVSYSNVNYVSIAANNVNHQPDTSAAWWLAADPPEVNPQMCLRWSDDGSKTWSNEHWVSCGKAGQFLTRAIWRMLGRSRSRIYEISMNAAIPWRIVAAYLKVEPGTGA